MTIDEKNELLDNLSTCYNRVNYLEILAQEKGSGPDVIAQIGRRKSRLRNEIDMLLNDLYTQWIGDATQLKSNISDNNNNLNQCIAKITKDVSTAQNIVKALSYVDNVVKFASAFVS